MFKTLLKSVREYKRVSILTPIFMAGEVAMECVIPLVIAQLINSVNGKSLTPVIKFGVILLAMAACSLAFGALSGRFAARASAGFAKNLRKDLFYKVQDFSFGNVDRFSASGLVTRLTTDVTNVQNAYMMIIRMAVRFPLMFVTALIMSFTVNWKMACIFLGVVPVLGICMFFIIKKAYPLFDVVFKQYDDLNDRTHENIKGMRVVKTYAHEDYEIQKFEKSAEKIRKSFLKPERIAALNSPLMWLCIFGIIILISVFGSIITVKGYNTELQTWGELSTGDISSLFIYATQILSSMMMLAMVLIMIIMANASAKRIAEVLNEKSDITSPASAVTELSSGDIEFKNVSFKYSADSQAEALSDINLTIKSGETIGIIGGTGCGKTSLVQLIPRLYDVYSGSVTVGGVDVRNYDLASLRNGVAMVLQKNLLFSGTIAENLRWGNGEADDGQVKHAAALACADEFVSSFPDGYDTYIEQGGTNVSGGQKQRLTIARALLKKPKILILDDSTSAVDTKTDALIRKAFKEEISGTTKIIIAQRTSSVMDADRIVVMDNGRISAIGTHEQLLESSVIYREVYESQTKTA